MEYGSILEDTLRKKKQREIEYNKRSSEKTESSYKSKKKKKNNMKRCIVLRIESKLLFPKIRES